MIRQEIAGDRNEIFQVIQSAFDHAEYTNHDEHRLVDRLRLSDAFIPELSLVAEINGKIVGHILFTKIQIGAAIELALAPVSVRPDFQSQGIGGMLITEGHRIAGELGFGGCVVLGHAGYYPRFGYVPASRFKIHAPFDVPDENFMAVELRPHGLDGISGTVAYAREFFEQ